MSKAGKTYSNKLVIYTIFAFFVAVYLLTSSCLNVDETDVGFHRMQVLKSMYERHDFNVPAGMGLTGADGRDYSWFGLGSVLVSLPFYVFGRLTGVAPTNLVTVVNQFFGAATVVLVFLFCGRLGYSRRSSIYASIFYGLGTMAWYYAKDSGEHVLETSFVVLSFFGMYRYMSNEKARYILISGASFGMAFLTRGNSMLVALPLFLMLPANYIKKYDLRKTLTLILRDAGFFSISVIPFAVIFLWYNYYRFGSIFESGYGLMGNRLGIDFFSGTSLITGLAGLLASPGKGFFYYSPIAIIFFFTVRSFWKKHVIIAAGFIGTMVLYILFYAKYVFWHGDWAWGPRYIFVLTPFFVIPIAECFESQCWIRSKIVRIVCLSLLALGMMVQVLAVSVNTCSYFIYLKTEKKINFAVYKGIGVQPINTPEMETYFNWKLSPILVHAQMAYVIITKMKDYRYLNDQNHSGSMEKIAEMNLLDYWWIYKYYIDGNRVGLIVFPVFMLYIIVVGKRLLKIALL